MYDEEGLQLNLISTNKSSITVTARRLRYSFSVLGKILQPATWRSIELKRLLLLLPLPASTTASSSSQGDVRCKEAYGPDWVAEVNNGFVVGCQQVEVHKACFKDRRDAKTGELDCW